MPITPELLTDLYEFTMAAGYWRERMFEEAVFSLFIRDYPPNRAYFVAAGLDSLLDLVERFRFPDQALAYLAGLGLFPDEFLNYLKVFKFTGSIRAVAEGRMVFSGEPLLEIRAPIIQGQLLETLAVNTLHLETLIATKAARCVEAARGRTLVDFALRRTHGFDAGLACARSSYLAGFQGSSNVLAGQVFGLPVYGTMAHSYVTSFPSELAAFRAYARLYPDQTVLLVDTYDTLCGTAKAIVVARELAAAGRRLRGVRLDSGDLVELSKKVRQLLRQNDCGEVAVMVSGNLDEFRLDQLLHDGAEIDVAGVGTRMGVSADAPYLDMAYKMVEYAGRPILKLSPGKVSWVGPKQIWRHYDDSGRMRGDTLGLAGEADFSADALLHTVMQDGVRMQPRESLAVIRERCRLERAKLPESLRAIRVKPHYPVTVSERLQDLQARTRNQKLVAENEPSARGD